jgi:hypothetical protein
MKQFTQVFFFTMIVACAAIGGVLIGQNFLEKTGSAHHHATGDMHAIFHQKLNLNEQQGKQLAVIEKDYSRHRILLEEKMKLANMELAEAIKNGGYSSPQVLIVVDQIHQSMGNLQKLTLKHLADMQGVLGKDQNKKLEENVVEQLYRNARQ